MAKKRASLKDKGFETLGLTQTKGKGIDVLFGGAPVKKTADDEAAVTGLPDDTAAGAPPAPAAAPPSESMPFNEADEADVTSSEAFVDELGLPVAMEAPPSDLVLATPVAEAPQPPVPETPPVGVTAVADDLSGLVPEDDLLGLADEAGVGPTAAAIPPANLPPGPPSAAAAPAETVVSRPEYRPPPPPSATYTLPTSPPPRTYTTPTPPPPPPPTPQPQPAAPPPPSPPPLAASTPAASALGTPPSTATGAPSLSMPRSRIESVSGIASEKIEVAEEDLLPEDTREQEASNVLEVRPLEQVEKDEVIARKVTRYVGRERRDSLDQEIERLYDEVASELSVNKGDAEFALKVLSRAQDIVFEDTRQYDEALYLVAIVRTMIARKRNLRRWSYTWGSFVFFYAVAWLIAFIAGYIFDQQLSGMIGGTSAGVNAIRAAWFSALAGGIGGVIGILYSLYWHVAMKQDFDRQYVMYYMVQPVMGFVLGAVVYYVIAAGFLLFNFASDPAADSQKVLGSTTVVALQVLFGWIAGFRQRFVFEMIDKIVQRVSPRPEGDDESKSPVSLVPSEQLEKVETRLAEGEKSATGAA